MVKTGQVSSIELVEEAINRVEAHNPQFNAVVSKLYDQARKVAQGGLPDGPFKGVPFLLKDLMATYAGEPLSSGSRFLRDYIPDFDSELVKRYKKAGLVILGKTNTPEFGIVPYTEPALFGPARNPWEYFSHDGRFEWRLGRSRRCSVCANGKWGRWRWLNPHSGFLLWSFWV